MRIITAANERYFARIVPYLDSLNQHVAIPAYLVCIGDKPYRHPHIVSVTLARSHNRGAPYETESPQHGAWMQAIDGPDDETCIFTDGDIIAQRPLTKAEFEALDQVQGVMCGYNSGPDETLAVEGMRLGPRVSMTGLSYIFGDVHKIPCYNIGVIAAKRRVWRQIYAEYMRQWDIVCEAFTHPARQQWLVCWTFHKLGIPVNIMPYTLHANGHYGMPPGCAYGTDGNVYAGGEMVLFRHKL